MFTDDDNSRILEPLDKQYILETINKSNVNAAPGSDGIPTLFYKDCWDIIGDTLTEVILAIFNGLAPTKSRRTSLMVFGSKPKKLMSLLPKDKRRISLLNSDFKILTGIEATKLKKTLNRTLCQHQYVSGDDRKIHHGITKVRNSIEYANSRNIPAAFLDTDYIAVFDFLIMSWTFKVLMKKGMSPEAINRLKNLYNNNITIPVINNVRQKEIPNL